MKVHSLVIEDCVRRALLEDLGHGHDITTGLLQPGRRRKAVMRARKKGVLAGTDAAVMALKMVDPELEVTLHEEDGAKLKEGQDILTIRGQATSILTAERTALNFVTFMSGIATRTQEFVQAVKGTKASIVCTRKTLPGLRALQKYAVRVGGGKNHRFGLDDAILIKDNHIALSGGIEEAIQAAIENAGHMVKIEVEVDTLFQLEKALKYKIDAVLLDNMNPEDIWKAIAMIDKKIITEASGGIDIDSVRKVAESGVDLISVGALTHSLTALDIGLDIDL